MSDELTGDGSLVRDGHALRGPASADRYRDIFEAVALPVLVIDAESWLIVDVNEAAQHEYGYTRDEFIRLSALEVRPAEGRADAERALSRMPQGFWKAEAVRHMRKDGSIFRADVWSRDALVDGRTVRIATVSNVTERVELQHELQQAQKMEAVGRLAGGIAHDFNNALTAIMGSVGLLRESALGKDPGTAADLEDIRVGAERAAELTGRLLAFGRRQLMRVETFSLNDLLERSEALLRGSLPENVEVDARPGAELWPVRADPSRLEQVVMNLGLNARDAMPAGGRLTLATRNVHLAREERRDGMTVPAGEYVELCVRDTGTGMDEITRARVFEPFFTTKPPPQGTGLGLAMVHGIVRQSGGFVGVASSLGAGATFRILLPRAGEQDAGEEAVQASVPGSEHFATVLLVEEEDLVRGISGRVLEAMGCEVLSSADGREALACVERDRPELDLLLTDLHMTHMEGRELAAELRALYPDLCVLFVSGYGGEAAGETGLLGDRMGYLRKPFSVESLAESVRSVLESR